MKTWSVLLVGVSLALAACGGSGNNLDEATLEITPGTSTLTVRNGAAAQQAFVAQVRFADNSTQIVTADTVFSIDRLALGSFLADTFTAPGTAGGEGVVLGVYMGLSGQAAVTVNVATTRVVAPASPDAPSWFDTATDDPARAPFLPDRANNGLDPSAPAFRLPFQDLSGKNHIAQWTEQVVPVQ